MDRNRRERAEEHLRRAAVHGVFTVAMACEAGLTRAAVRHRQESGRWRHVTGGAFVDVETPRRRWLSEVRLRAIGSALSWPGSVVCLRTAALLHGMPVPDDGETHVIVRDRRRPSAGLVPHRFALAPRDVRSRSGFRLTARRRTALDCLMLLPPREAESLMAWVRTRDVLGEEELRRGVRDRSGCRGVTQLRRLTSATAAGALSELERLLHQLLHEAGITGWVANEPLVVGGRVVARADVLFPAEAVVVEVDGRAYHADFDGDRARQNTLTLAGYTVLRFTWTQLTEQPEDVVRQIRAALAVSRSRRLRREGGSRRW